MVFKSPTRRVRVSPTHRIFGLWDRRGGAALAVLLGSSPTLRRIVAVGSDGCRRGRIGARARARTTLRGLHFRAKARRHRVPKLMDSVGVGSNEVLGSAYDRLKFEYSFTATYVSFQSGVA